MSEEIVNHIHKNVDDNKDSLEIGSPSKGGAIKVYLDFSNLDACKTKITQVVIARAYLQEKVGVQ